MFSTPPAPTSIPTPLTRPSTPSGFFQQGTAEAQSPKVPDEIIQPYLCSAFKIDNRIIYMADVSYIPDDAWPIINAHPLALCALDCLQLTTHSSHMALDESVAAARRINASRTYLLGFSHRVSHEEYLTIADFAGLESEVRASRDRVNLTEVEKTGVDMLGDGAPIWLRPAHDGLRAWINPQGQVRDETYL
jgi:hypothetical protein